jgi:hypothetical protein
MQPTSPERQRLDILRRDAERKILGGKAVRASGAALARRVRRMAHPQAGGWVGARGSVPAPPAAAQLPTARSARNLRADRAVIAGQ